MIAVDQQSSNNKELLVDGGLVVWRADDANSPAGKKGHYYAVFNLGNTPASFLYSWKQLSLAGRDHHVVDLWDTQEKAHAEKLQGTLPPHGSALFRVDDFPSRR